MFIHAFGKRYLARRGWKWRSRSTVALVGMLLIVAAAIPIGLTGSGVVRTGFSPEKIAMTVSGLEVVDNATVEYDGSVIVPPGKSLVIRNSTVRFNVAKPGETRFYLKEGASLTIFNSTLTADGYFLFLVYGDATITDSVICRTWSTDDYGGVYIVSDNVTIRRTTVESGKLFGIMAVGHAPRILDCTVQKNELGIYLYHTKAEVSNNTVRNNTVGIYAYRSECQLINNTIQNNTYHGLTIESSTLYVERNRFYDNKRFAIVVYGTQEPYLVDNEFVDNKMGIVDHRTRSNTYQYIFLSTLPSVFVVLFPMMYLGHRREKMFSKVKAGRED